ncbi:MAG TPA: GNAT family N-acetyltransferase [Anaerolineales bacterium]|nr:GNAT family N-acetyltransferase [Anaerolineales bacterium]
MSFNNPLQPETLYRIVCRPALPKDTPEVLELTSKIWEGEDYVPHVWAEWLADYQGLLAVAEYGGRVVGLSKLTYLDPESWWLEGLRVHPDYEGRRIASRLHDYLLEHWQKAGSGAIRLATISEREPVKHLAERTGFRKALEVGSFIAESVPGEGSRYAPVVRGELDEALGIAAGGESLELCAGLVKLDWRWAGLTHQHLAEAQARTGAWWWVQGGQRCGLLIGRENEHEGKRMLMVQMIACSVGQLPACLRDCRTLAAGLGLELAAWFAPLHPLILEALKMAGFERDWDGSLCIFEKRQA